MGTNRPVYWNRMGYVAIEDRSGRMIEYGGANGALDFKFNGEITADICPTFNVGILGLSLDTVNQLTAWNPAETYERKRKIEVYAGYEQDGISNPLFSGFVIEALPTNPPEMWLNFKCMMNINDSGPVKSSDKDTEKRTLEEIWNEIAKANNVKARWEAKRVDKDKKVVFSFGGKSPRKLITEFMDRFNVLCVFIDGVLVCKDDRPWQDPQNPVEIINTQTGLLGIAGVSVKGATVKRRLSDTTKCFDCVRVVSEIMPKANGSYMILSKRHVGHFRGDDWYTELELIRMETK